MSSQSTDNRPVVVAGHVCLDIIPALLGAGLPRPGQLLEVGPAMFTTGGAVANVGGALARLGVPVRLIASVGDDRAADIVRSILSGVGDVHLTALPGVPTSYSVVLAPHGTDRSFLHCPGANQRFDPSDVSDVQLQGCGALHFGYPPLMPGVFRDDGEALADLFGRARRCGLRTSLDFCSIDPNGAAAKVDWLGWMRRVLPHVDVFVPSLDEIVDSIGAARVASILDLAALAGRLCDMGSAAVVLKLGEDGLYLHGSTDRTRVQRAGLDSSWVAGAHLAPAWDVPVVSATGAGDAMVAGLIVALRGTERGMRAAGDFAAAVGASSCLAADATSGVMPEDQTRHRFSEPRGKRRATRFG